MFAVRARLGVLFFVAVGVAAPATAADPKAITWQTDYNAARKEAQDKNLPLLVVVGTEDCFYCRKLDASTFRDAGIISQVTGKFIALKVDAHKEPNLAKALKVQVYPTLVLAGPDGKIHNFIEGYLEPERFAEHLKRAVAASTTTDWMARDFNEASKAIGAGDYPRAVGLLKGLIREAGEKPVGIKAKDVLDGVEKQAAGKLIRAKELEERGYSPEAMDALAEVLKTYAGTQAAADAANLMAGIADKPETREKQRSRQARDLLALAKDDFRAGRYYECLQRTEQLSLAFADRPESKEGASLASEIRGNPERLAAACEQMNDRTAAMYLALAESWSKKGQDKEAAACLEKVVKLSPASRHAEQAQVRLAKIQGRNPATATGFTKP
jgi:thioredoxin-related protein